MRQIRSLRPLPLPRLKHCGFSSGLSRAMGALVAVVVCAAPAVAATPAPNASETGGGTSLPAIPLVLADDAPCTAASDSTAKAASWAQRSLSLPNAWQLSRGEGVTVAVVGTGVSPRAPGLSGRVTAAGDADDDCVGRGTFTAGLIAAAQTGGSAFRGVAPEARVLAVRGTDRLGNATADRVADAIREAVDGGAEIVAVCLALAAGEDELTSAVRYATSRDVLVVAPAAPDADPQSEESVSEYWPASSPGALSVVGVKEEGGVLDSAAGVSGADLAAPGGPVVGIGPRGSGHYISSGSSAAAAFAAGTAALVRAYHPDLTAAETADRLIASAAPTGNAPRLDPYAAVSLVPPGPTSPAAAPPAAPLHLPAVSTTPRNRALLAAGIMTGLVLLVAVAAVVIPRGRARGWRPPS